MPLTKRVRRRRKYVFSTFVLCCLGASLMAAALATENWFEANCHSNLANSHGHVNFGLFEGESYIAQYTWRIHHLKVVCLNGLCMYSCAPTKALRRQQLREVMNGTADEFSVSENCPKETTARQVQPGYFAPAYIQEPHVEGDEDGEDPSSAAFWKSLVPHLKASWWEAPLSLALNTGDGEDANHYIENAQDPYVTTAGEAEGGQDNDEQSETTIATESPVESAVFMDYGLWVGTIACLSLGMMFAVVGALFAVINTATTPVEAITGVPGLYVWNTLAALFNLICVILWAVQFHENLTKNVLLYDASNGWTTEGMEVFGYSFWLVVVAIFVHVANIAIIFIGTYEPKAKDQVQAPDTKGSNIMLY
ncbi:uncharacterized protein [Panulirus ornatus]|uniref:uncharacterized protein isoform X1 n=1 Tax=Panulirus ornatus TaxID=150431 RepID=UPI003A8392A1